MILLSAVLIGILVKLACGIGISMTLRVKLMLTSVLDSLYWYLMCIGVLYLFSLVGGQWRSEIECGLWEFSLSAISSLTTLDIGARPLMGFDVLRVLVIL